ncbi:MAG TPA: IS110 family transposase [Terriglobales bacterium]|nr:IS110 family transposase [Terriglobales bacterium]
MQIASVGIDLGKTTFHLVALDEHGKIVARKKFSRQQLLAYTVNLPSSLIGIEACSGAHFIGAALRDQGHDVRLIPAQFVKPFLKSNKNDFLDAEAIAEAVARQNMRFVPIKTDDQLDLQALHRVRDRLVHRRTALINQIRGFLLERGIIFPQGPANLRRQMPAILEDAEQKITPRMRNLLDHLWQEWKSLNAEIESISDEVDAIANQDAACQRLRRIPGVGPLVATATVAAIGNGAAFRKGREFAAWLGLIPRQHSTGGKARLLGISKRGSIYLRRMFIHGARDMLLRVKYDTGRLGQWAHELELRAPRNKVVVAVANKLARIAWAVLATGNEYCNQAIAAA